MYFYIQEMILIQKLSSLCSASVPYKCHKLYWTSKETATLL